MKQLFRVRSDPDRYQNVWYRDEDEAMFHLLATGQRIGDRWKAPLLKRGDPRQTVMEIPDFPALSFDCLCCSAGAWEVIRPLVSGSVEALPAIHPTGRQELILNVIRVIDCLKVEECETNRLPDDPTGYFSAIYRYSFKQDLIEGEHLFRCPEMKGLEVYGSLEFKQLVQKSGLTGLRFKQIYPPKE